MYTGIPPFEKAAFKDPYYKTLLKNKFKTFWKAHSKGKPGKRKFFEPEFKDLIQKMLKLKPAERLSIE